MFSTSRGPGHSTLLYQGPPPLNLYYRQLQPADYDALKAVHHELFPIDYEEVFFRKAVGGEDRVFSCVAVHSEYGTEHLVGFVTARLVYLYECDPVDRSALGLASHALDGHCCVYVLTLGVVPSCRQCGVARALLSMVAQHAARMRCRAIFLHVIAYNEAAMRLYGNAGYQPVARLPNFYHLNTGRQPNPDQYWYDAYLYATFLPSAGPEPSPAMQWAGGVLGAAVAPLRSVLGSFNGCMPGWLCSQTYGTFLPFAGPGGPPQTSSNGSLSDTATSRWQQPGPHPPAVPPVPPPPPSLGRSNGDHTNGSRCAAWQAQQSWEQAQDQGHGAQRSGGECSWGNGWETVQTGSGRATEGPAGRGPGGCGTRPVAEGCRHPLAVEDPASSFCPSSPPQCLPGRAPSHSSMQHRHSHGSANGADSNRGHQGYSDSRAAHQHQEYGRAVHYGTCGGVGGAGDCSGQGGCSGQPRGQEHALQRAHGRNGEHGRGGIPYTPAGLGGGGLQQPQQQRRQGQQPGSLLASLLGAPRRPGQ